MVAFGFDIAATTSSKLFTTSLVSIKNESTTNINIFEHTNSWTDLAQYKTREIF